jgi:cellulose synthase operon protein YhjU
MGLWSFYFITKIYWHEKGFIQLNAILTFGFLVFLLWSSALGKGQKRSGGIFIFAINLILGLAILWYESWLPSASKSLSFFEQGALPNVEFISQFLFRLLNLKEFLILITAFILCLLADRRRIRLTPVVVLLLFVVSFQNFYQPKGKVNQAVQAFYENESRRKVSIDDKLSREQFDIIIVHVCSLSWDDLREVGLENDSFFRQFDLLMMGFNSVTTYSAPSAIRLLRAPCGQGRDKDLYQDPGSDCYLVDDFKKMGYDIVYLLNHDGKFASFSYDVQKFAHLPNPIYPTQLPVQAYGFDNSLVYNDYSVLEHGWKIREASRADKSFLYYNSISLHEGTRDYGSQNESTIDRKGKYKRSVTKLFEDITRFIHLVETSGKKSIVLFVPEHGTALRGSRFQPAGLREIPLPQITTVPVGIKIIGKSEKQVSVQQEIVSTPTSYLSLAYLLSHFMNQNPFVTNIHASREWIESIPQTAFLSENDHAKIFKIDQDFVLEAEGKPWTKISSTEFKPERLEK